MNNITIRDSEQPYICDALIFKEQQECARIKHELNNCPAYDFEKIKVITSKLLGKSNNAFINPPFFCDYGKNIIAGNNLFINYNCTILDVAKVYIGDNCFIGPNTGIYTVGHPIHPYLRNKGIEYGLSIKIGNNVWIGGNVVICPSVQIGDNCTIGAGSVVTHDIEENSIAVGNPCRVIRKLTDEDKKFYYKNKEPDEELKEFLKI